jgi:hypothetical protein
MKADRELIELAKKETLEAMRVRRAPRYGKPTIRGASIAGATVAFSNSRFIFLFVSVKTSLATTLSSVSKADLWLYVRRFALR